MMENKRWGVPVPHYYIEHVPTRWEQDFAATLPSQKANVQLPKFYRFLAV